MPGKKQHQALTETWWINSAKIDCTGTGPMTCFQVQKGEAIEEGKWTLFYDQISGFDYEPGFIYELEVEVSKNIASVPADASSLSYKLIQVHSKTQDPSLALTNIWKVLQVGAIQDPKSQKGEALTFELNGSEGTYFVTTDCNSIRGGFSAEKKGEIRFGPGAATMMACSNMEVESEIKKVLELIRKFEIKNNVLYLQDEKGETLMSLKAVD
jgi:heat shock protein HslJ